MREKNSNYLSVIDHFLHLLVVLGLDGVASDKVREKLGGGVRLIRVGVCEHLRQLLKRLLIADTCSVEFYK